MHLFRAFLLAIAALLASQPVQAATTNLTAIELRVGLNAIGYPIAGSGQTTLFALLELLGDDTLIERLSVFDPRTGAFSSARYDSTGVPVGSDAPVRFGDGVFVVARRAATIAVPEPATCRPLHLAAGVNLISLPCAAPDLTAFDLLRTIGGSSGIVTIERFDGGRARFEAATSGAEPMGTNFAITPGEALFVHTQAALAQWDVQLVGPAGGTFEFANGLTLEVPPGALAEPVAITLAAVACDTVEGVIDAPVLSTLEKTCLRAFEGLPDGLQFAQPATVSFTTNIQAPQQVPISAVLSEDGSGYDIEQTSLTYTEGVLSIQIEHFSARAALRASSKLELSGDPLPAECAIVPTPPGSCCTTYSVQSTAGDVSTGGAQCGNCQIVGEQIDILFPNCPGSPAQRIIASEASGACPQDLAMVINPPDATLWTCQDQELEVELTGTNPESGAICTFSAPARWVRPPGSTATFTFEQGPINTGTIRATTPGTATLRAINTADPTFRTDFDVEFRTLSGTWSNAFLTGSEICTLDGTEITIEDDGPEFFDVAVQHTCNATSNSIRITSVDLPQAEAFEGPLTETGNADEPFSFDTVGFQSSSQSVDCLVLVDSNGTDIIFGDVPLCDSEGNACEIQSCSETELLQGNVSSAIAQIISGVNTFTFNATWDELVPAEGGGFTREPHSLTCRDRGDVIFQANKL